MLKVNKTTNVSAQVMVDVENEQRQVAYLSASIGSDKNVNINKAIQDSALFTANKTAVLSDFEEFETLVYEMINE